MNLKIKIALLFIAIVGISCEDYLIEEPPTFISGSNYFKTASDARTAVDGVYQSMSQVHNRFWTAVDAYTDDQVSKTKPSGQTNYNEFGQHTLTPSNVVIEGQGIYSNWWIGIGRANTVLEHVPNIEMDETEKNAVLGEARALRAYFYYQLVRTYGDVPMIVELVTNEEGFMKPRTSAEDIYDQVIIPDLKFAEENCGDGLHDGHFTKWSAKLLLSEVYLTRAGHRRTSQGDFIQGDAINWELARDKAKEVIDNSPHSLNLVGSGDVPAYGMAWKSDQPFTKESMLEISYVPITGLGSWLSRGCNANANGRFYWGSSNSDKPLENEGIDASIGAMRFPGRPSSVGLHIPTPDLYSAFEDGDERLWSIMTRYNVSSTEVYLCQPAFRKFVDIPYFLGEEGSSFQYTNQNVILYRYADALLIYAEAQNEADGGPNTAAYKAVNDIRNRAGLGNLATGLSQSDFRQAVLHERRVEFNAEFKRRFDLIRTNRLVAETTDIMLDWTAEQGSASDYFNCFQSFYDNRPTWPDNEWLFPIPQSEIELNVDNGWIQNEGY